jgi:methionine-rich copper-binding protein CopC
MMSRRFAAVVTIVIVIAFVVVAVAPAFAAAPAAPVSLTLHARLASSTPADGATVESAEQVVLTFNEAVNPDFVAVRVTGPDGSEADGKPTSSGAAVTQPLRADLPASTHTVTYRVVSADGHPVAGTMTFTTTAAPATGSPSATSSASPTPSSTVTSPPSSQPTVGTEPAAEASDRGLTPWLVGGGVAVLVALAIGAARRTVHGPGAEAASPPVADPTDVPDEDRPTA